MCLQTKE